MHWTPDAALQQAELSPALQRPPLLTQPELGLRQTSGEDGSVGDLGKQLPSQQSLPVVQLAPSALHGASAQ